LRTPVTSLDTRYSSPKASAITWSQTVEEIEAAELFWLATVRSDGRPHVTPLVAVWARDELHFTTGPAEQKTLNLRTNAHVALTTGRNEWNDGVDVVVEGVAQRQSDLAVMEDVATVFQTKWDGRWAYEPRDGGFFHPDDFEVELYSVLPTKVLAFAKGTFGHTVHNF
jgi:nitroimidazol reductase NimA-like FMN-containing flavoprotein (pyridoxamine 5'-phosphate oxidase superfamily)